MDAINKESVNKVNSTSVDSTDFKNFITVLYYCVTIIALPISTFFFAKFFLFDYLCGSTTIQSNVYSALAAIVVLHLALGFYIYKAYTDTSLKPAKQD